MLKNVALKKAYEYLDKNPEENIPKIIDWLETFVPNAKDNHAFQVAKENLQDHDSNWYQFVISLFTDIDKDVRNTLFNNFLLNAYFKWADEKPKSEKKIGAKLPWTMLIDPTTRCNLRCTGCWAAEYGKSLELSFDDIDSIITQGKELGIYMYLFSGGEPLVRKDDIIKICEKHNDCVFSCFTNGTLIDEAFVKEMLRVKNLIPGISVEGDEETTDSRRGPGTFKQVERAMDLLKENKLPFGLSCCYTRNNTEIISSPEFFDWMINKGAKFAWFFTYMPTGAGSPTDLMATAEQREAMYHAIRGYRSTKPIFTMDFWNDGEYVDGCIAGGKCYFHINANGDVEPCAFIHYSDRNIHENTLIEALQSPLFKEYQAEQPFNKNLLRPCPVLDNPGRLTAMVNRTDATSTDYKDPETPEEYCNKCVDAAKSWAPTAGKLWEKTKEEKEKFQ